MFNFAKLNDKTMKVQIINKSKHSLPQYATSSSAGMDLRANLDNPTAIQSDMIYIIFRISMTIKNKGIAHHSI